VLHYASKLGEYSEEGKEKSNQIQIASKDMGQSRRWHRSLASAPTGRQRCVAKTIEIYSRLTCVLALI
jgi:hypothetical protein